MSAMVWANVAPGDIAGAVAINPSLSPTERVTREIEGLRRELEHPMPDGFLWTSDDSAFEQGEWISRLARIDDAADIYTAWESATNAALRDRLALAIAGSPGSCRMPQRRHIATELVRIMRGDAPLWMREQAAGVLPLAANTDVGTRDLAVRALTDMLQDAAHRSKPGDVIMGFSWEYPVRDAAGYALRCFGLVTKRRGPAGKEAYEEWDIVPPYPGSPRGPGVPAWHATVYRPVTLCTLLGQRGFEIRRDEADNALVATRGSDLLRLWPDRKEAEWKGERIQLDEAPYVVNHFDIRPDVRVKLLSRIDGRSPAAG
jgi:hypothetical protein